jgi:murein DD-endopeptidase MepM/ murein hydrolase activator NlpD
MTAAFSIAIPNLVTPDAAKAAASVKQTARADVELTLPEAEGELTAAEAEVQQAAKRIKKTAKQIKGAEQELAAATLQAALTKVEVSSVDVATTTVEEDVEQAKGERDAAMEVLDLVRGGGVSPDLATAAVTGDGVSQAAFGAATFPVIKIAEAEEQATKAQATFVAAVSRLCSARLREGDAEGRVVGATREQDSALKTIEAAEQKRQTAREAEKSAKSQVDDAEEAVAHAKIEEQRAAEAALASRSMDRPGNGDVTSPFGMRTHPITGVYKLHSGTDFGSGDGVARAARPGTVVSVTYDGAYGNMVTLSHGNIDGDDVKTRYAHLASATVSTGEDVGAGDAIGNIGSTGYATGAHLHFEVLVNDDFVDPMEWLSS